VNSRTTTVPELEGQLQGPATDYVLDYQSPLDRLLQGKLQTIDAEIRAKHAIENSEPAVGVLDLRRLRLAMLNGDHLEYAASVPKVAILLAYFHFHPEAATNLQLETRHELGLMIKTSSNEMATKFSRQLGLKQIQDVLNSCSFYEVNRGGGIWMGKHYGQNEERVGDPLGDHSHAATVRQLLRFYLLLEQQKLVSPQASRTMREIFESPQIPHDNIKFVAGLAGRNVGIIRKWGSWEDWLHDTAVIKGPGRHYILAALTHTPKGDDYLTDLARAVDDVLLDGQST
jgi:beta-lactamase class A